jgi:hypothetical protein
MLSEREAPVQQQAAVVVKEGVEVGAPGLAGALGIGEVRSLE